MGLIANNLSKDKNLFTIRIIAKSFSLIDFLALIFISP